jgi:uncharacterized protein
MAHATVVGLISDTHGLMRPQALDALRGSAHIIHAGDIGNADVLCALRNIAPLTVIRGNNDRDPWAAHIPETEVVEIAGVFIYVVHDLAQIDLDPQAAGFLAVIAGHSHQPRIERRAGVLYVNPGSAGPRRFRLPIAVGELSISGTQVSARIIELPF